MADRQEAVSTFDVRAFALEKAVQTMPYTTNREDQEPPAETIARARLYLAFLKGGEQA